ncbi:hypothetical protein UA08_01363 [Talaromyces atroroseus]|uniref:Uncharacterized protein n=1 Tax=Talaromyces atroroseus TaxID=1441469 RepID=A0A1Q5Q9U7_TALAT|nr:hypothetical protein UA08_01363 [Talaromyces atroroseus]OKL62713.1 hypothetical protein UA08_01363 [Talaromyces atroroseus]
MVVFQQTPGPSANPTSVPPSGRDGFIAAIQGTNSGLEQLMRDGLHAYSSYLDHQIWKCVSKAGPEWSAVFGPRNQWAAKIFSVLTIVTKYLSTSDSQTSLSDIVRHLLVETQSWGVKNRLQVRQAHDSDSDDMTLLLEHHLVFACLGWLSMLYTPFHDFSGSSDFRILRTDSMSSHLTNNAAVLNASDMHRPMGTMLRKMGLLPIMCPAMPPFRAPGGDSATFMKLSTVCYSSLRQIGEVSILWVNNLSEHCQFDAKRQELKIFRFPAYCLYLKRMESDVKDFNSSYLPPAIKEL